jgi:transcriptional/translational regulatory protein YebC/TACO1
MKRNAIQCSGLFKKNNMAQQTSVEWFYNKISNIEVNFDDGNLIDKIFQQAKAMEKEQILNAFVSGSWLPACRTINSEQYYNETYSNGKKN